MIKLFYLAFLVALLSPSLASACSWPRTTLDMLNDSPASMVTSKNNKFLLKMLPSRWEQKGENYFKITASIGTVLKLRKNGDFQYQWNAKNIAPHEVKADLSKSEYFAILLSNDGKRLVKIKRFSNSLKSDNEILTSKDFLVIYEQGKVSHRYSYFDVFKKLPHIMLWDCPGGNWVSDIKLEGNLLSLKSEYPSSKNTKEWSVDISSGKTAK